MNKIILLSLFLFLVSPQVFSDDKKKNEEEIGVLKINIYDERVIGEQNIENILNTLETYLSDNEITILNIYMPQFRGEPGIDYGNFPDTSARLPSAPSGSSDWGIGYYPSPDGDGLPCYGYHKLSDVGDQKSQIDTIYFEKNYILYFKNLTQKKQFDEFISTTLNTYKPHPFKEDFGATFKGYYKYKIDPIVSAEFTIHYTSGFGYNYNKGIAKCNSVDYSIAVESFSPDDLLDKLSVFYGLKIKPLEYLKKSDPQKYHSLMLLSRNQTDDLFYNGDGTELLFLTYEEKYYLQGRSEPISISSRIIEQKLLSGELIKTESWTSWFPKIFGR